MDLLANNSLAILQKSLDVAWQKQGLISENIANSTTPGYKAKYLTFEDELRRSLKGVKSAADVKAAVANSSATVHTSRDEALTNDGNNVNVDAEYVEMARAQIHYDYLVQQVSGQFTRLQTVIQGR